jgi:hypothetical protein
MPLEDFLNSMCNVTAEAPTGQFPPQDAVGGADRSDANWVGVAQGVPCLVRPRSSHLEAMPGRNDARMNVVDTRVYFAADPVPGGLNSRNRIVVTSCPDPALIGIYAVQGVIDPNGMGRLFEADCERVRTP